MEKTAWKTLAIIFFIIALLETSLFVWAYVEIGNDEKKQLTCSYEICEGYGESFYEEGICTCYDWDKEGRGWTIAKESVIR
jgi:hypothetical protein